MEKINYKVTCSSGYQDAAGPCNIESLNDGQIIFGYSHQTQAIAWSPRGNEYGYPDPNPFLKIDPDKQFISEIKLYRAYTTYDSRFREEMMITHIDCEYSNAKIETIATNIIIPFKEYTVIKVNCRNIRSLWLFFRPQSTHGLGVAAISELQLYAPNRSCLYLKEDNSVYGTRETFT